MSPGALYLVHPVFFHSELSPVPVRGFGSVILLLDLLVLHSHFVSELRDAE